MSSMTSRVGAWRVALRLARRDAMKAKLRSTLVIALIALPIAAATGADLATREALTAQAPLAKATRELGTSATARLQWVGEPLEQDIYGTMATFTGNGPTLTFTEASTQLGGLLPEGARVVTAGLAGRSILETPNAGLIASVAYADFAEKAVADAQSLRAGRLPRTESEIALASETARQLGIGVGDTVTMTVSGAGDKAEKMTVVGVLDFSSDSVALLTPARIAHQEAQTEDFYSGTGSAFFVVSDTPITWPNVIKLNAVGWQVISRAVIDNPPAFCKAGDICALNFARAKAPTEDPIYNAEVAGAVSLVAILAIMQIALLAAPAFTVQLRRRERELGLLAANGADSSTLRRTMLASGVFLGFVGSAIGVALGTAVVLVLGGSNPWNYLAQALGTTIGWPEFSFDILIIMAIGISAAVAGAWATANAASKTDVIHALRGRRAPLPIRFRTPLLGLGLTIVGSVLLTYATARNDQYILTAGLLSGELGIILMIPWLIMRVSKVARFLPVSMRMSMRDAARQRLRTAAAIAAITAVTTANVAVGMWDLSSEFYYNYESATTQPGDYVFSTYTQSPDDTSLTAIDERLIQAVKGTYPNARTATLRTLLANFPGASYNWMSCVLPEKSEQRLAYDSFCNNREGLGMFDSAVLAIDNPANISILLGPTADNERAQAALEAGKAIVLQSGLLNSKGEVAVGSVDESTSNGKYVLTQLPAVEMTDGAAPAMVIVGPAALLPSSPLAQLTKPETGDVVQMVQHQIHVELGEPATPSTVDPYDRLSLIVAKYNASGYLHVPPQPSGKLQLLGFAFLGVIALALFASLMVTSLTLVDARADFATLAAVGAAPTMRRRVAAASAGFLTLFGAVLGSIAGIAVSVLLSQRLVGFQILNLHVPWMSLGVSTIAVPALTAGVAWLVTSSKIEITRRID